MTPGLVRGKDNTGGRASRRYASLPPSWSPPDASTSHL